MRTRLLASLVALALSPVVAGCAADTETGDEGEAEQELKAVSAEAVAKASNTFGTKLYATIATGDDNLFFSPYSISTALAMTYGGARGTTQSAMRKTLELPAGDVHAGFGALGRALASRSQEGNAATRPELNVANSLWGEKTQPFEPAYTALVKRSYGAGLEVADFLKKPEAERARINAWVEDKTNDKITDLLGQGTITSQTKLVLVNAIYFKAGWQRPFDVQNTEKADFSPLSGAKKKVDMMATTRDMPHHATAAYDAVALPYAGDDLELVAIAPKAGTFRTFESSFDATKLGTIRDAMTSQRVALELPKFRIEGASVKLKDQLTKLGMGVAFSDSADFRGITGDSSTKVGDVIHKAFIALDEKGTEAAAATAVVIMAKSAMPRPAVPAVFDRPFLFAIRDVPTGAILFMGRVTKP
jgi:serpin B